MPLPARLVPISSAPCPLTHSNVYMRGSCNAVSRCCSLQRYCVRPVAQLVPPALSPTPEPLAAHPGNWQRKGLDAKDTRCQGAVTTGWKQLVPCPSDPDDPSSRSWGGVGRGAHPLHRPPILLDRSKDSMRAWTDGRTLLSHRSDPQHVDELLIDPGPPWAQS